MRHESVSHTRTVTAARRRLAFLHDVEVVVEGRDLVDLGLRELHRLGERGQVRGGEVAEAVLDAMQVLDQVLGVERRALEHRRHFGARDGIDGAPLGRGPCAADLGDGDDDVGHAGKIPVDSILRLLVRGLFGG